MLRAIRILFFLFAGATVTQAQDRDQHIRDQLFNEVIDLQVVMICNSFGLENTAMIISTNNDWAMEYCVRYFGMLNGQKVKKIKVISHKHVAGNEYIFWVQIRQTTDPFLGNIDLILVHASVSRGV